MPIALRLFLPAAWADDPKCCRAAGIPRRYCVHTEKWQLALEEIDRVMAAGLTVGTAFGLVLADSGYGSCAPFRTALSAGGRGYDLRTYVGDGSRSCFTTGAGSALATGYHHTGRVRTAKANCSLSGFALLLHGISAARSFETCYAFVS